MFARTLRTLRSSNRIMWTAALLSLFILAACGSPAPAAESSQMEASATESEAPAESEEAMAEEVMTEEDDVGGDMSEAEKVDDSDMAESHAMTETVESDMASETEGTAEMGEAEAAEEAMAEEEMVGEKMTEEEMVAIDLPAWQKLALTDARSGESFTFADFNGKTVFVEPMATWCSNCRRQLTNVQEASAQFGDDVVFIALSVETNIGDDALVSYADNEGFAYTFAVMTPEMLGELAGAFGQTISNPPATPHFIIRPDGSTTDLVTGIEPADEIAAQIEAARG